MKIVAITPLGPYITVDNPNISAEELQLGLEEILKAETKFLTLTTREGYVILGGDLVKRSVFRILPANENI